jgi:nicotinate-nucleotide adenylyltransferase
MLRGATEHDDAVVVDDCELRRTPPSYTIDTVEEIRKREGAAGIFLFIGEDNLAGLPEWHRFPELEKMVRFVVLSRSGKPAAHSYATISRKIDISATEIRKRVASGRSIRYLVPPAVEEIIRQGKLYRGSAT